MKSFVHLIDSSFILKTELKHSIIDACKILKNMYLKKSGISILDKMKCLFYDSVQSYR